MVLDDDRFEVVTETVMGLVCFRLKVELGLGLGLGLWFQQTISYAVSDLPGTRYLHVYGKVYMNQVLLFAVLEKLVYEKYDQQLVHS